MSTYLKFQNLQTELWRQRTDQWAGGEEGLDRRTEGTFVEVGLSFEVVLPWVYISIRTHLTIFLRRVHFIV